MELEIKPDRKIEEGSHVGAIIRVEYRDTPFKYTDLIIEMDGITLKSGYPTIVTSDSKLGQLFRRFGAVLEVGKKIDPDKVFIGRKCTFLTMNKTTKKGTFAEVLQDSVKPV